MKKTIFTTGLIFGLFVSPVASAMESSVYIKFKDKFHISKMSVGNVYDVYLEHNLPEISSDSAIGLYIEDYYNKSTGFVSWINSVAKDGPTSFLLPKVANFGGEMRSIPTSNYVLIVKYYKGCSAVCDESKKIYETKTYKPVFIKGDDEKSFLVREIKNESVRPNQNYFGMVGVFGDYSMPVNFTVEGLPSTMSFKKFDVNIPQEQDHLCFVGSCRDLANEYIIMEGTALAGEYPVKINVVDGIGNKSTHTIKIKISDLAVDKNYSVRNGFGVFRNYEMDKLFLMKNGHKMEVFPSVAVKNYGVDLQKVPVLSFEETVSIPDQKFIRLKTSRTIYLLEGGRRRVMHPSAIRRLGADLGSTFELYWNHFYSFPDAGPLR